MLWNVWGGADIRCVQKEVERGSTGHKARSAGYGQARSPDVHEGGGADARCAREVESASHTPEGVGTLTCARGGCGRGVESARPDVRVNAGCEVSRDKEKYGWGNTYLTSCILCSRFPSFSLLSGRRCRCHTATSSFLPRHGQRRRGRGRHGCCCCCCCCCYCCC